MAGSSRNQLYGDQQPVPGLKSQSPSVAEPPAQAYGAQGMRGRLYRLGLPSLDRSGSLGRQSVQSAFKKITGR